MLSAQNSARSSSKYYVLVTTPHEDADSDDEARSHPSSTVPSSPQSTSPKPVQCLPAGHRRSSTFGNLPWMAMHQNVAKVEDAAPTPSRRPLSFDELNMKKSSLCVSSTMTFRLWLPSVGGPKHGVKLNLVQVKRMHLASIMVMTMGQRIPKHSQILLCLRPSHLWMCLPRLRTPLKMRQREH
ncbi:hypothetical protein JVT61DRAFT_13693 [Boletus reticuloceps]|uniref:Uncharacterized protein n=1 Tax=Boletus reticuloceps TaxID=495285 RepID=A0A8I2YTS1_9AGAM|nr:hypothetical protein JVT61DRAFT_13693 [Boletus reticuloceps]